MNYLKDLFVQGKYHLYIGFGVFLQCERRYLLPHTNLYKKIRQTAIEELRITNPDQDNSNLVLENMSNDDLNNLKSLTKKKVVEIKNISSDQQATLPLSFAVLGLGSINYFLNPTVCALFVGGYLSILALDYAKSISVIKFGIQPAWTWKMKDMGYVVACCFAAATCVVVTKASIAKLKDRATKAMVLRQSQDMPRKKQ